MLPKGFVYLDDSRILTSLRYATPENFTGRVVDGYRAPVCILSEAAFLALKKVQDILDKENPGLCLKIFDAYRPLRACADFLRWSLAPGEESQKANYYPDLEKSTLFEKGYISKKSGHCRGSTVDLTLVAPSKQDKDSVEELFMGTPFDFFGEKSHTDNPNIPELARKNRDLLRNVMQAVGFENYHLEWWHFTLENEPFKDTYFDFEIL